MRYKQQIQQRRYVSVDPGMAAAANTAKTVFKTPKWTFCFTEYTFADLKTIQIYLRQKSWKP
jgi:hypothetical protein